MILIPPSPPRAKRTESQADFVWRAARCDLPSKIVVDPELYRSTIQSLEERISRVASDDLQTVALMEAKLVAMQKWSDYQKEAFAYNDLLENYKKSGERPQFGDVKRPNFDEISSFFLRVMRETSQSVYDVSPLSNCTLSPSPCSEIDLYPFDIELDAPSTISEPFLPFYDEISPEVTRILKRAPPSMFQGVDPGIPRFICDRRFLPQFRLHDRVVRLKSGARSGV